MADWYKDTGFQSDIVLTTRVRLARNLSDFAFPHAIGDDDARKVIDSVDASLKSTNLEFSRKDILSLSPIERERLVEEHYISPKLAREKTPSAVFVSADRSVSIMVNEEDHIRMQAIFAGFECQRAVDIVSQLDRCMAQSLNYAVHQKYGYLTSCLTNAGTGMRVSLMMHLPAICKAGIADKLFSAMGKLGVTVRGMYGEGSKALGYLFQISNQMTLGVDEKEITDRLSDVAQQLISKERELRLALVKQEGISLEDKVKRSLGILKSAYLMSSKEMHTLFSNVRLGLSVGLIDDLKPEILNSLMIETAPAHLTEDMESARDRDAKRAKMIREKLNL